jgi:sulfite exporter TauE/SafE
MVIQAALLGLSTGLYCATACFPMLISACFSRAGNGRLAAAKGVGQFLLGRLAAYLVVGAAAGLAGFLLGRFHVAADLLVSTVYLVSGGLMAVYGIVESFPHVKACAAMSRGFRTSTYMLVLGFLTGLNLCPPFVLAFSAAADLGGVAKAVLFFLVFFLATSVYMLPFLFSGLAAKRVSVRKAARIVSVAMGAWFVYTGVHRLVLEAVGWLAGRSVGGF